MYRQSRSPRKKKKIYYKSRNKMAVQDYEINTQIGKIAKHVEVILNNAFIRKALSKIVLSHEYQAGMDILLSSSEIYKVNGYLLDEIYRGILGLAMWSYKARTEMLPELKYHLSGESMPEMDRIREQMALENLKSNLDILADEVNNLFVKTVAADKASHKQKSPVYLRISDLGNLGQLLTSDTRGLLH
jgi:hypothetical protein